MMTVMQMRVWVKTLLKRTPLTFFFAFLNQATVDCVIVLEEELEREFGSWEVRLDDKWQDYLSEEEESEVAAEEEEEAAAKTSSTLQQKMAQQQQLQQRQHWQQQQQKLRIEVVERMELSADNAVEEFIAGVLEGNAIEGFNVHVEDPDNGQSLSADMGSGQPVESHSESHRLWRMELRSETRPVVQHVGQHTQPHVQQQHVQQQHEQRHEPGVNHLIREGQSTSQQGCVEHEIEEQLKSNEEP